jgi:hypothetical protein
VLGVDICDLRGNAFSVLAATVESSRPQPGINHRTIVDRSVMRKYIRAPNGKPRLFVALRLQKNVIRLVDDIAYKEGASRSEVIRSLIKEGIKSVLTKGQE